MDKRWTIAVDFDGVIHSYTTPWIDAETIPDPPVTGAIEWLEDMNRHFKVVIHTTRAKTMDGQAAVRNWLGAHGFSAAYVGEGSHRIEVTAIKPSALIYIDDRAWRFEGCFPSEHEIHSARPWHRVA